MAKGVHHLLVGGGLKSAGGLFVACFARQFGEITVLDVRHRLAGKGSFEVGQGLDVGAC
jgi:hypothetical protein